MNPKLTTPPQASLFNRVIGAAGFQLINVNNVSLRLGGWATDTQLVSRKALAATLARHFRDEFIKEAHKVTGSGAQPENPHLAIADHVSAPAVLSWPFEHPTASRYSTGCFAKIKRRNSGR
jgi:hypothetical protein